MPTKETFKERYPLVSFVLDGNDVQPEWCQGCPFCVDTPSKNHSCYCTAMRKHIKTAKSECTAEHWKNWVKKEISA
jgi:hypothetical protein